MAKTFSESWYQVAPLKLALLPTVKVHKQVYRGEEWFVLQDSCSEKYYRVRPFAYRFLMELTAEKTFEEVWMSFVERHPKDAPSQEEAIQLIAQLHHANILHYRSQSDHDVLYSRYQKVKERETLGKLMAFLYVRVPVWNPNDWLNRNIDWAQHLFTKGFFAFWLALILWGGFTAFENSDQMFTEGQGLLSVDNLIWLYISLFVLKFFHEMGHAIACKAFGAEVNTMGVMFIVFTPLPYVDATSSWTMRSRWQRALVGVAGMYVELFFAAVAAIVWANTADGFIHNLAFNLMVIGSLSSLLFNGNPLLRFDAYYILSDLTDIPNLYQKANQQWFYYFDHFMLGTKNSKPAAEDRYEAIWMTSYGFLSYFYRLFVMLVIMLYVADLWLGLAVLVLIVTLVMWVFIPLMKLFKHLFSNKIDNNRYRAYGVTTLMAAVFVGFIGWVPLPYSIESPGVVKAAQSSQYFMQSGGVLEKVMVKDGDVVQKGQLLAAFRDVDLEIEINIIGHQLQEAEWLLRQALDAGNRDTESIVRRKNYLDSRLADLQEKKRQLHFYAQHEGFWRSENLLQKVGNTFARGELVGQVVSLDEMKFVAAVAQEQASDLFGNPVNDVEIKLFGQATETLVSNDAKFLPFEKYSLPSDALGIHGGGEIITKTLEDGEVVTTEPFFEFKADLPNDLSDRAVYLEGQLGMVKIPLEWRSAYDQMRQSVLQLMQKRYQI